MGYTFKKSTCERYDIRFRGEWAIITISENGGLFNCHSSYGDWNYSWPHHGRPSFKHFLIELAKDTDYLLNKVSDKILDFDKTISKWKRQIITERKKCYCDKEVAREAFDFLRIDECSEECLGFMVDNSEAMGEIFDNPYECLEMVRGYPHEARVFADEIMQIFAEIIKKEIGSAGT